MINVLELLNEEDPLKAQEKLLKMQRAQTERIIRCTPSSGTPKAPAPKK